MSKVKESPVEKTAKKMGAEARPGFDYSHLAGSGFENVRAQDQSIPYLTILQGLSPQVKKSEGKYIAGAEEGMVLNNVTNHVFNARKTDGEPILVIPCGFMKKWVEWRPRSSGGGFVKHHDTEEILAGTRKDDKNKDVLETGNVIVETAYHSVLVVGEDGAVTPALIAMSSTQLKKSRNWISVMAALRMTSDDGSKFMPPTFAHQYAMTTVPESNQHGSWFGWSIERAKLNDDKEIIGEATRLHKAATSGQLSLPAPVEEEATTAPAKPIKEY